MYAKPKAIASYGRMANTETDPIRQIVMLYDGAIKFLNLTALDIEAGDFVAKGEHSRRALDILSYLQSILDFDKGQEVAVNLDNLYRAVTVMVLKASAKTDPSLMRKAGELLMPVRDAWQVNAGAPPPQMMETNGFAMVG
jgi:flagellar secretion chaperone FliS